MKKITSNKNLWLRNNLSTALSSLIDNSVFSILAWIILNPDPEKLYNVIMIYILGTYFIRIFIALLDTPILYLSKFTGRKIMSGHSCLAIIDGIADFTPNFLAI